MSSSLYQIYANRTPANGYSFHLLSKGYTNPKLKKQADQLGHPATHQKPEVFARTVDWAVPIRSTDASSRNLPLPPPSREIFGWSRVRSSKLSSDAAAADQSIWMSGLGALAFGTFYEP
jgi:hypothetical protein